MTEMTFGTRKLQFQKVSGAYNLNIPKYAVLGVCLMVGAEDLSFVDSGDEWIRIKKTKTETGLIIEIGAGESVILLEIVGDEDNPKTGCRWYDCAKESVEYIGRNLVPLMFVLDIVLDKFCGM